MTLAPIILFVYNRPAHTRQTLEALRVNRLADQSDLVIFSDGAKDGATEEEKIKIKEVRKTIREKSWCKSVKIIESECNKGLAKSITEGVTKIVNEFNKVIVLEDDIVPATHFLQFMNDALTLYENNPRIACISGYIYPVAETLPETFYLKGADCWGWATWKRAWNSFEMDGKKLLLAIADKELQFEFDFNGTYPFNKMLEDQVNGRNDSWAIRWYASSFLNNMLCLYPGKSLVKNIGIDGSGIHSGISTDWEVESTNQRVNVATIEATENTAAKKSVMNYFRKLKSGKALNVIRNNPLRILVRKLINKFSRPTKKYGWFGNYNSWSKALSKCSGYDSEIILEKVKVAALKVKNGEAVYERDSVLFDKIEYAESILNALQSVVNANNGVLHVVDFGGSLGSSFFQYRQLLKNVREIKWSVVEQKRFVDCGKRYFESEQLKFYDTIEETLASSQPHVLFLSSVIQYVEKPYDLIQKCIQFGFEQILIDRTAFIESKKERLTVQVVPEFIYKASYPAWFLNEDKFVNAFTKKYKLISRFESKTDPKEKLDGIWTYRKGFVFKSLS